MKEVSIEQKAKAYDEAIKKAKDWHIDCQLSFKKALEELFPELKESEDEEIRKWIIDDIRYNMDNESLNNSEYKKKAEKAIAWLEKQGEKIPANSAKTCKDGPRFKVGDEIKTTNEEPLTITKIDDKGYWSEDLFICDFDEECLWELVAQKLAWSEDDEKMVKDIIAAIDTLYYHGMVNWLKSLKDRVQPQPKQEWSEEDEDYINDLIKYFSQNERLKNTKEDIVIWLKSIKDRHIWKPSDEQMDVLLSEVTAWTKGCHKQLVLESLYNDLKKLREE